MSGVAGSKNYYDVLGVPNDATAEDIKHAFRRLASQFHPDRNPGDITVEAKFKEVNEAYQVLGDDSKRQVYDFDLRMGSVAAHVRTAPGGKVNPDLQDIMNDLFQDIDFAPFRTPRRAASTQETFRQDGAGDNILLNLEITLEESLSGCKKPVIAKGPRPNVRCGTCGGIGTKPGSRRVTCSACAGHGKQFNYNGRGNKPCQVCAGTGQIPR